MTLLYLRITLDSTHAPAEADANDTLHLENCILSVETSGNEYELNGNVLSVVRHRLNGSVTAEAWVYTAAPEKVVEFEYNSAGLRVQKKVTDHGQTVTTEYIYHGKKLVELTCGNDTLHFFYDMQGRPAQIVYNEEKYAFVYSLQGDGVAILDCTGTIVVEYNYNIWGEEVQVTDATSKSLGQKNPFRYRGYIYDDETRFYFILSRYYNAALSKMCSADDVLKTRRELGCNLYCYCRNNPVKMVDPDGREEFNSTSLTSFGRLVREFLFRYMPSYIKELERLTAPERNLALNYPYAAYIVSESSDDASKCTNLLFKTTDGTLPTNADGSVANAYKHAMWNALMTKRIGFDVAEAFATAHESSTIGNTNPYRGRTEGDHAEMDLYYNNVGRTIAAENPDVSEGELAMLVLEAVLADQSAVLNGGAVLDAQKLLILIASGNSLDF